MEGAIHIASVTNRENLVFAVAQATTSLFINRDNCFQIIKEEKKYQPLIIVYCRKIYNTYDRGFVRIAEIVLAKFVNL